MIPIFSICLYLNLWAAGVLSHSDRQEKKRCCFNSKGWLRFTGKVLSFLESL